ncbi:MAG TPA: response regulator [Luteitalea sp.]|nr:response regulator [Luteitalea sp.]
MALVLVVDDDPDHRDLLGTYLRAQGYRIEEAKDGLEAVNKTLSLRPDVVVMDLEMPTLDGWAATSILRHNARARHIPIICLSAREGAAERDSALRAGCVSFLTKPCPPADVVAEIRRVLGVLPIPLSEA